MIHSCVQVAILSSKFLKHWMQFNRVVPGMVALSYPEYSAASCVGAGPLNLLQFGVPSLLAPITWHIPEAHSATVGHSISLRPVLLLCLRAAESAAHTQSHCLHRPSQHDIL